MLNDLFQIETIRIYLSIFIQGVTPDIPALSVSRFFSLFILIPWENVGGGESKTSIFCSWRRKKQTTENKQMNITEQEEQKSWVLMWGRAEKSMKANSLGFFFK